MRIRCTFVARTGLAMLLAAGLASCREPGSQNAPASQHGADTAATGMAATGGSPLQAYVPAQGVKPFSSCNLERLGSTVFQGQLIEWARGEAQFSGWVALSSAAKPTYWLRFDDEHSAGHFQVRLSRSIERPDVIAIPANASLPRDVGFRVRVPALPPGRYHAYLAVIDADVVHVCDNGREVLATE